MGREDIGYLAPSMAADFFLVDVGTLEFAGALHDAKNILPKLGVSGPVDMTVINGKIVFEDGALPGINERQLAREGESVCTRVLRKNCSVFQRLATEM